MFFLDTKHVIRLKVLMSGFDLHPVRRKSRDLQSTVCLLLGHLATMVTFRYYVHLIRLLTQKNNSYRLELD